VTLNILFVDDTLDQSNYAAERLHYLINFIAHRDGRDMRPAIKAGEIGLAELEEMFEGGLDPDELDSVSHDEGAEDQGRFNHVS
jgi:dTDP-D-glucose 4,6-dehydratase